MLHSSSRRGGVAVEKLPGTEYERWFVAARRLARATGPQPAGLTAGNTGPASSGTD
jgi:hypothetical protein